MKLLILNGSPKTKNSATLKLIDAFVGGMEETACVEKEQLHVCSMNIGHCRGCLACRANGGRCVQNDDMEGILDSMKAADVMLFAFPLYGYSVPSQMKAVLDRMMPLSSQAMRRTEEGTVHPALYDHSRQRFIMLSGCGFPNARHNFEPVELMFRYMFRHDLTQITVAEAPMLTAEAAAAVTGPFLERVREAGREYGRAGTLGGETLAALRAPMIPEDIYARICSGEA